MNTATHPTQIPGTPRRQFLAGAVWLPLIASSTASAAVIVMLAWLTPFGKPHQELVVLLACAGVAVGVALGIGAAAIRRRSWWAVNPSAADYDHAPRWVRGLQAAGRLLPQAAIAAYIATYPGLLTALMAVLLTTMSIGLLVLPHIFDMALRLAARLSSRVVAKVTHRPVRVWESAGIVAIHVAMWAVPAAVSNSLWGQVPVGGIGYAVFLALTVTVVLALVSDAFESSSNLRGTMRRSMAPA